MFCDYKKMTIQIHKQQINSVLQFFSLRLNYLFEK